jgi:hypothetical protein
MHMVGRFCLICCVFFLSAHRLPGPIVEESPTPANEAHTKPKKQHASGAAATKSPSPNQSRTAIILPAKPTKRFAGTWSGTVNVPNPLVGGNTTCTYIINDAENSVKENCERFNANTSTAVVSGNRITWKNGMFKEYTNVLTVFGDANVGQVTISSSWGNGSGTVRRIAP